MRAPFNFLQSRVSSKETTDKLETLNSGNPNKWFCQVKIICVSEKKQEEIWKKISTIWLNKLYEWNNSIMKLWLSSDRSLPVHRHSFIIASRFIQAYNQWFIQNCEAYRLTRHTSQCIHVNHQAGSLLLKIFLRRCVAARLCVTSLPSSFFPSQTVF